MSEKVKFGFPIPVADIAFGKELDS